jgi:tRNA-dihydrouridine synthase
MRIGRYKLPARAVLAPMAGVTDRPFRILCRELGAGLAASEMLTSDTRLWSTPKSRHRMDHSGEPEPRVVQLAGSDPDALAHAARCNVELGAQIIDINMGCPAKKVCGKLCGSALLTDELLVGRILEAVVRAVSVPVTLKMRTGWDPSRRNGVHIARLAESCGVEARGLLPRLRGVRDDPPYQIRSANSSLRERRYRLARQGARCARVHRGRRRDDRAREPRQSVDFPNCQRPTFHGRTGCAASARARACYYSRASRISVRFLR